MEKLIETAHLLVTIVERNKTEFYLDVISQYEVNMQFVTLGKGTAPTKMLEVLGLTNSKGVIFSIVPDKHIKEVKQALEKRFSTVKNGKGVSVVLPVSSVCGKLIYQFMINNRLRVGEPSGK